jgi:5-methyltetrahydropteroyltriglutamate--homocysteine methyltransferase
VSTKTPVLETLDGLKRRVEEAGRAIDVARLAIGPQCGFASTVAGNPLSEADQRAKLGLIVHAAAEIWGE